MKTLKFRKHLADMILDWQKYTTWRLFDDKDISEYDVSMTYSFLISGTNEEFAKAKIIGVRETTFGNLTEDDWDGHEKFESEKQMYETYSGYYNREVTKDSPVKVIKFELIKQS
ncbi:MAG: ASCH domain-containing protein [Candidatus Pacebacteria bacterium]|nr:ASCH domain-containing protein [Candidatus Paceibacterota bacterium]